MVDLLVTALALRHSSVTIDFMNSSRYDCVVIGCGPGGSSASTFLARDGRRVLTLAHR